MGRTKVAFWPALGKVPIKSSRETRLVYKDKDDVSPQGTISSLYSVLVANKEREGDLYGVNESEAVDQK